MGNMKPIAREGALSPLAQRAQQVLDSRRWFEAALPQAEFADPQRDILLHLYVAAEEGRPVSQNSCRMAAAVPPTTALRHIERMKERGLIQEAADPRDARRKLLNLSPEAQAVVRTYLGRLQLD